MIEPDYVIEPIVSAPFDQIGYAAWRRGRDDAIVVDPGFDAPAFLERLAQAGKRLAAIVNTHGHVDHIAGNRALKEASPDVPLVIGRNEAALLSDPVANLSAGFRLAVTSPPADRLLDAGDRVELAGFAFRIREIPGHSPGSIVLIAEDYDPPFVFGGDVLFAGSVGRTDFPGGNAATLLAGIREHLFSLPGATLILPGHGPTTTVDAERRTNPFVGDQARPADHD